MYMYLGNFPSEAPMLLQHEYCSENVIKIKYKRISDSPKSGPAVQQQQAPVKGGKEKSSGRTIGEVQEIVKKWRKISL